MSFPIQLHSSLDLIWLWVKTKRTPGEHQNSWDLWVFIPLKSILGGFDTHLDGLSFLWNLGFAGSNERSFDLVNRCESVAILVGNQRIGFIQNWLGNRFFPFGDMRRQCCLILFFWLFADGTICCPKTQELTGEELERHDQFLKAKEDPTGVWVKLNTGSVKKIWLVYG